MALKSLQRAANENMYPRIPAGHVEAQADNTKDQDVPGEGERVPHRPICMPD